MSFKWNGEQVVARVRGATVQGMGDALEYVLAQSNKIIPHDLGDLQRSGDTGAEQTAQGVKGFISYDTPYAVRLHEHPEYNFNKGRQGKWLESTIRKEEAAVTKFLKDSCQRELR